MSDLAPDETNWAEAMAVMNDATLAMLIHMIDETSVEADEVWAHHERLWTLDIIAKAEVERRGGWGVLGIEPPPPSK